MSPAGAGAGDGAGADRGARPGVRLLAALAAVGGLLGGAAALLAFGADQLWFCDTLAAFRLQLAAGTTLAALTLLVLGRRRVGLLVAVLAAVAWAPVAPLWWAADGGASAGDAPGASGSTMPVLRLTTFNQKVGNRRVDEAAEVLRQRPADLVLLQEAERPLVEALTGDGAPYRVLVEAFREVAVTSAALLVRRDLPGTLEVLDAGLLERDGLWDLPSPWVRLRLDGDPLTILGLRAPPPRGPEESTRARAAVDTAVTWWAEKPDSDALVVLGDLNATPWNRTHRRLRAALGLEDSSRGNGYQPTFPAARRRHLPLRIPIDHCLHDPALVTRERTLLPGVTGSDHAPLHVVLGWRDG